MFIMCQRGTETRRKDKKKKPKIISNKNSWNNIAIEIVNDIWLVGLCHPIDLDFLDFIHHLYKYISTGT